MPSRGPRTAKARSQVFAKWETIGKPTIFPDELLVARRKLIGYELGGPPFLAFLTFVLFVGLWFGYIFLSVANSNALQAAAA